MIVGYARVSSVGEGLDVQKEALDKANVDRLFIDVAWGAKAGRPQLELALSLLRKGDILVVWKLDRLARSVRHLIETVEDLGQRGVGVRSLAENIDTTTSVGKLMFPAFGKAMAEVERTVMRERTKAGRAAATACGRKGGRKPKLDEQKRALALILYDDQSLSVDDVCRKLGISRATLHRYLRHGSKGKAATREVLSTG